jgi:hypothetical protein
LVLAFCCLTIIAGSLEGDESRLIHGPFRSLISHGEFPWRFSMAMLVHNDHPQPTGWIVESDWVFCIFMWVKQCQKSAHVWWFYHVLPSHPWKKLGILVDGKHDIVLSRPSWGWLRKRGSLRGSIFTLMSAAIGFLAEIGRDRCFSWDFNGGFHKWWYPKMMAYNGKYH